MTVKLFSRKALLCVFIVSLTTACGNHHEAITVEAIDETSAETPNFEVPDFQAPNFQVRYEPSKIIGLSPLVPVKADGSNMEEPIRKILNAFGIISLGEAGACSGTHIGKNLVLTAGHCFLDGTASTELKSAPCKDTKVYWGYRGSPATGSEKPKVNLVSQCTKIVYAALNDKVDFAIFKVDHAPLTFIPLASEMKRTALGTKVTILGYPRGRPLEWSQYCAVKSSSMLGHGTPNSLFTHQCDTEPGNSGSSVIALNQKGEYRVVGVHNAAASGDAKYNIATYAFDLRKALSSQNRTSKTK